MGKTPSSRDFADSVEKRLAVGQRMLKADESPRQVGRRIVIRLEPEAKVGRHNRFSTQPSQSRYCYKSAIGNRAYCI